MKTPNNLFPEPEGTPPKRRSWLPETAKARRWWLVFLVLFTAALLGYAISWIAYPRQIFQRDRGIASFIGRPTNAAVEELERLGFKAKIAADESDPSVPAGSVTWQDPPAGLVAPAGLTVYLTRSTGPGPLTVPDLRNFDPDLARKVLLAAGLKIKNVDSISSAVEPGAVVGTRPVGGSVQSPGAAIEVLVSLGASNAVVPNVIGQSLADARRALVAAGFRVGQIIRVASNNPPESVVSQRPTAGITVAQRSRVDLTIAEEK